MFEPLFHAGWIWGMALYLLGAGLLIGWLYQIVKRDEPRYPRYTEED